MEAGREPPPAPSAAGIGLLWTRPHAPSGRTMRAIVVGAGDVGYDVARLLSLQRHDVTVVDTDPQKVD